MSKGPINLNRVRKLRARDEKRQQADENAARFGRTKTQRALAEAQTDKAVRALDAHRRDVDKDA